ncbi:MAG: hypothetical protein IKZ09_02575, partial [Clostridia bacterium]|nr:hypothetical protein [Clostridia bacterium]
MKYTASEIISVGTELLLGDIINTDAAFLARELAALGIPCYYQSVVGDNPARLQATLKTALSRSDLIILTGGLGPTADDLTKETAAALMGKTLVLHEPSYARIRDILQKRNLPETENQKKQAMLPADATVFQNDYGTAPGFAMKAQTEYGERTMILLPGPPRELEPLYLERVRPYLAASADEIFFSLNIGTTGMVNYGSYLSDDEDIPKSTLMVVITDFCVAFLAGLIIIPSAFAFNIDVGSGPALQFITMPSLFAQLPGGKVQCYNEWIGGKPNNTETGTLSYLPEYAGPPESHYNT